MAKEIKKTAGVSGNSVAGKSFQIFTVSEELLAKVVEAVQAGEKEAKSSGNIQSFEVFCHGFRANISLGRIMIVPAKVCNDRQNFPTALLHGAIIRVFGWGGEEVADLVEKKIGESEFDEYSQADFDTIKKELFTDIKTGEEASLIVFAPNWMNSREYICFHYTDNAEALKNDLRHQVFSAYYNPAVSSAFNALMTNVDTTKVDVTDITPKLSYPFLTENPLKQYPQLDKQAGYKKATILLNKKTADDITKQTLDPQELDVFDSLNQALENSLMPDTTSVEDAGETEGGYRAPDDGGVPREASTKDAGGTKRFYENRNDLPALEAAYAALPVTATPEEFVAGGGNWGLTEGEYITAMELATNIIRLKQKHASKKVAHIDANGICPGCKKAGSECACKGCTCKSAFAKKAYVAHVPGHKNSKGESAPWVIKQHNTGKILESFKSEAAAKAGLRNMESHKGSAENAPHGTPFTNVGPGSAAHAEQEAAAPAMKESVGEDNPEHREIDGAPIGIAIDETGVPRSKTEESEGKSKEAKKAVQVQNPSNRKRETSHPETLRVGPDRLTSAMSATFNGGYRDVTATDSVLHPYTEKTGLGNNADYPTHAAADHEKQIAAGAYGEDPLNRRSNEKWGSAKVDVNFKRSTAAQTFPTGDDFTDAYIEAALWAETDPDTMEPLDKTHGYSDIAPATLERFKQDCAKFQKDNAQLLEQAYQQEGYNGSGEWSPQEQAGHDFWLTRNGHGAGFWDRQALKGGLGEALTKAAKAFREADLYVGDDGKIYQMGAEGTSPESYVASQVARTASAPFEAISTKAKAARAKKESLLDKFRPKTAVELDIDSIWDAITEDMGPAPLVDVPEIGDTNPAPSNTEQHEGFDEEPKAPSKSPNKKDIGNLPEAFRTDKPEEDKAISDGEAETQETDLENSATKSEEHHEAPEESHEEEGEKKWHESNWNSPESKYADFIDEVSQDIEAEEEETREPITCDQCEILGINGVACHERGCPNQGARWDEESGTWVKQRKCFDCGMEVDADDPCCSAPFEEEEEEAHFSSVEKEATGEMSQQEANDPRAWPLHHAIAKALGGTVKPFDQYQGPYVLVGSEVRGQGTYAPAIPMKGTVRLWIQFEESGFATVYNEDNEKVSEAFPWDDEQAAVEAAKSVLDQPPTKGKGKSLAVGASTKKADTADNGYDIDKAPNPSDKETGPSDTVECHQDYNTERSEGSDRPKPGAGAEIKTATGRMTRRIQLIDDKIWEKLGIQSGGELMPEHGGDPKLYERYKQEVLSALAKAGIKEVPTSVIHELEDENFHRINKVICDSGLGKYASVKKADTADNPANWKGGEGIIQPKTDAEIKDTTGPDAPPPGQKQADDISGDAAEAKAETVSPDTVDKDIQQPTVSVSEAAKVASEWMNEYEIDEAARFLGNDPVVGKYIRFLQEFVGEVNSHSDGWHSWPLPARAASQLMTLIKAAFNQKRGFTRSNEPQVEVTEQMLRKSLGPIKSFYTRRGNQAGMQMPHIAADISGDMSEAKSELDYNKADMADEPKATDTVNPEHFASKGTCADCGAMANLDKSDLCHDCRTEAKAASIGERHDDVPVAEGNIPDEKQPKSNLSGAAPEAHDVPPQVDSKTACGEDQPESIEFDFGAGDLADIVLVEDEEKE